AVPYGSMLTASSAYSSRCAVSNFPSRQSATSRSAISAVVIIRGRLTPGGSQQRAQISRGLVAAPAHRLEDPAGHRRLPGTEARRQSPLVQAVEAPGQGQGGAAPAGQAQPLDAAVLGVGAALEVTASLHLVDDLGGALVGHAQTSRQRPE